MFGTGVVQQIKEQIHLRASKFQLILKGYLIYLGKGGKMVIGDPYVFSIIIEVVDEWNENKVFNNGLLFMSINGILFLPKILNASLNCELSQLIERMKCPKINEDTFQMEKKEAFVHIYNLTYPNDWDADYDYSYIITPNEFEDNNCFVFMVSNGEKIRILAASELQYIKEESTHNLQDIDVAEAYISKEELERIIEKLNFFEMQIQSN